MTICRKCSTRCPPGAAWPRPSVSPGQLVDSRLPGRRAGRRCRRRPRGCGGREWRALRAARAGGAAPAPMATCWRRARGGGGGSRPVVCWRRLPHPLPASPLSRAVAITVGPACQSVEKLVELIEAGVTCARIDLTVGAARPRRCWRLGTHALTVCSVQRPECMRTAKLAPRIWPGHAGSAAVGALSSRTAPQQQQQRCPSPHPPRTPSHPVPPACLCLPARSGRPSSTTAPACSTCKRPCAAPSACAPSCSTAWGAS
jgi:hypothetical protein